MNWNSRSCWRVSWDPLDGYDEQAKKRQMIEQRLQDKLKKETDSVRRAEEAKKDKTTANRKEEDLQLKDSIVRLPFSNISVPVPTSPPLPMLLRP